MKSWLGKVLVILGIALFISSARGIAADLGQVTLSWRNSPVGSLTSSQQLTNIRERSSGMSSDVRPASRSQSISPVFLDSKGGEAAAQSPTSSPQSALQLVPTESSPEAVDLPRASFRAAEQFPQIEPTQFPGDPTRIVIPAIQLDAPVVVSPARTISVAGKDYEQWSAPDEFAAGWQEGSARLGEIGNTVLIGHHNVHGEVFRYLVDLQPGDTIQVYSGSRLFSYLITNRMILPEKYQDIDVRMDNARWILPSTDERLTLITCWPYETNTHRLIIVAVPNSIP